MHLIKDLVFLEDKKSDIKEHTAKTKMLKAKVAATMKAWHDAQKELDEHLKHHPNYESMKAKRDAKYANEPYFEPGRTAEPGSR